MANISLNIANHDQWWNQATHQMQQWGAAAAVMEKQAKAVTEITWTAAKEAEAEAAAVEAAWTPMVATVHDHGFENVAAVERQLGARVAEGEENSLTLCYGRRDRVLPMTTKCVDCNSPVYIITRVLFLLIECTCFILLPAILTKLPVNFRIEGGFFLLLAELVIAWSSYTRVHWNSMFNLVSHAYYYPGSWIGANCWVGGVAGGYENRLLVRFILLLAPIFSVGLSCLIIILLANWRQAITYLSPRSLNLEELEGRKHRLLHDLTAIAAPVRQEPEANLIRLGRPTPHQLVLPPFTKENLKNEIITLFGAQEFRALQLLRDYERTLYGLYFENRLLFGYYRKYRFWSLLPILYVAWVVYTPKVCLVMIAALSCGVASDSKSNRMYMSFECGNYLKSTAAIALYKTAIGLTALIWILSIPAIVALTTDWGSTGHGPVSKFLGYSESTLKSQEEKRSKRKRMAPSIYTETLNTLISLGYHPKVWPGYILGRYLLRIGLMTLPMGTSLQKSSVAVSICCETIILTGDLILKPHTQQLFRIVGLITVSLSIYNILLLTNFLLILEDLPGVKDNRAYVDSIANTKHFEIIWCFQLITAVILPLLAFLYSLGQTASYKWFKWRSENVRSDVKVKKPHIWMHKIFYWFASWLEMRIVFDPVKNTVNILRYKKRSGSKRPTFELFFRSFEEGLSYFCRGPIACILHIHILGLMCRFVFEYVRHIRQHYNLTPSTQTLNELLQGLQVDNVADTTTDSSSEELAFDKWLTGGGGEDTKERNSYSFLLFNIEILRHCQDSLEERRWSQLCLRRQVIQFCTDATTPTSYNYIEVLQSEWTMAIEYLRDLTPDRTMEMLACFDSIRDRGSGGAGNLIELREHCDSLVDEILHERCLGDMSKKEIIGWFKDLAELAQVRSECAETYTSCVNTQSMVLENIARDNEFKLLQAGYSNDILKELACIQNVKSEVERTLMPIDILRNMQEVESSSDDDDSDLAEPEISHQDVSANTEEESSDSEGAIARGGFIVGGRFSDASGSSSAMTDIGQDEPKALVKDKPLQSDAPKISTPVEGAKETPQSISKESAAAAAADGESRARRQPRNRVSLGMNAAEITLNSNQYFGPEQNDAVKDDASKSPGWMTYVPPAQVPDVVKHSVGDAKQETNDMEPKFVNDDEVDSDSQEKVFNVWQEGWSEKVTPE